MPGRVERDQAAGAEASSGASSCALSRGDSPELAPAPAGVSARGDGLRRLPRPRGGFGRSGGARSPIARALVVFVPIGLRLRERRRLAYRLPAQEDQVAQHRVVEAEGPLEVVYHLRTALYVHQNVVRLVHLGDGIGELAASPVFEAMDPALLRLDDRPVALDHRGHLFALIRMDQDHDLVVSQGALPSAVRLPRVFGESRSRNRRTHASARRVREKARDSKGWNRGLQNACGATLRRGTRPPLPIH